MNLEDTVALVTGSGHRMGRAIALALAEEGCDVLVHYHRSAEPAEETARTIRQMGRRAETVSADLTDPALVDALFESFDKRFERLDILVNSAASFERQAIERITCEEWDKVQALNVRAPFLCTQHAALRMRATGSDFCPDRGVVINLADLSGLSTWNGYSHHGVSRASVLHLTKVSARELAPDIRVNAVVPGTILPPPGESTDSDTWRARGLRVPLARSGDPAHVSQAVVFLVRNDYVTGATILVDGGEHLLAGGRS